MDDFTTPFPSSKPFVSIDMNAPESVDSVSQTGLADVLGGRRGAGAGYAENGEIGLDTVTARIGANPLGPSAFDYQSSVGVRAQAFLSYGDDLNLDLNGKALRLAFSGFDPGASGLLVIADFGGPNFFSSRVTRTVSTPGAQVVDLDLASLNDLGFDFAAEVDSIQLTFAASAGTDFRLDSVSFQPVPEPASLAALGLGALTVLRRRKARAFEPLQKPDGGGLSIAA